MSRLIVLAAMCAFMWLPAHGALAAPVSESTVEKACGDKIQGGCAGDKCATGCEVTEGGNLVSYGCTFPNKSGKTKATCSKTIFRSGQKSGNKAVGGGPSALKAD